MRHISLAVLACSSLLLLPSAAQARTYWLDSYDAGSQTYAGPLSTERLANRIPYKVAVRGTFSLFSREELEGAVCGTTEPKPIYPSRRRPNGPVVADAEYLFADISRNCARRPSVQTASTFELKTYKRYRNATPIGGLGALPKPNHRYTYAVTGSNKVARFRLIDDFTKDNYGRLRVTISRARAADCAIGGFANWKYVDEATCVAATARKIRR